MALQISSNMLSPTPTYGPPYASVSHLFSTVSTTTWGNWNPSATTTPTDSLDPYGQSAWSAIWQQASLANFTTGIYSTTVSPAPVPSSELIPPPALYSNPSCEYDVPKDFILGVAGSAAQIEGAIADEGRGVASPDYLLSVAPNSSFYESIAGGSTFEPDYTTTENYYLYKQDIVRLAAMGIKYYSFSIAWTRILPFTFPGTPVNAQGLKHYDDLIDFAIENGIQPIVTLLHNDLPAAFYGNDSESYLKAYFDDRPYFGSLNGGYQYPDFKEAFVNYGRIVMAHFADRVPIWITINEPGTGATNGAAIDHVVKAHARLWHFYHEELQGTGLLSMKLGGWPGIPQDPNDANHVAAVKHYDELNIETFLDPLVLGEDYPDAYKMTIQDYVPLEEDDLVYLKGTIDFVATDLYGTFLITHIVPNISACAADNSTTNLAYPNCVGLTFSTSSGWNIGYHTDYFSYIAPTYLRTQLAYFHQTYNLSIMITEFGLSMHTESSPLNDIRFDLPRSDYYLSYLTEVLKAIWEDGIDVIGVLMWSFVDNWEVGTYKHAFGLQWRNQTTQERVYKRSFWDVVDFVEGRREK